MYQTSSDTPTLNTDPVPLKCNIWQADALLSPWKNQQLHSILMMGKILKWQKMEWLCAAAMRFKSEHEIHSLHKVDSAREEEETKHVKFSYLQHEFIHIWPFVTAFKYH